MSDQKAKSEVVAQLVRLARKERLSYDEFAYVCQQARRKLNLEKPKRERRLPQLLTSKQSNGWSWGYSGWKLRMPYQWGFFP